MAKIAGIEEAIEWAAVEKTFRRSIFRPKFADVERCPPASRWRRAEAGEPQIHCHVKLRVAQQFNWRRVFCLIM